MCRARPSSPISAGSPAKIAIVAFGSKGRLRPPNPFAKGALLPRGRPDAALSIYAVVAELVDAQR